MAVFFSQTQLNGFAKPKFWVWNSKPGFKLLQIE